MYYCLRFVLCFKLEIHRCYFKCLESACVIVDRPPPFMEDHFPKDTFRGLWQKLDVSKIETRNRWNFI